ncbi:hypothetical protein BKA93DRAFT_460201 [Sparassis latifolia]|uniref:Uncharacterized protein n=1 Tax=Sparassis crispa TaxID=139825 RepID=A0A401H6D9_9APHY|nr:hypothetical protein SCP_1800400 [Sparassis crispa]GBE90018.1 hypothetical protein SCP_1800400 [Sparassis crispa]
MSTSIEQAICTLVRQNKPLDIINVLTAYLHIVGYIEGADLTGVRLVPDAIIAFEHALDKQPVPRVRSPRATAPFTERPYAVEIAELRKQYWTEMMDIGGFSRCTCAACGHRFTYVPEEMIGENDAVPRQKRVGGLRRKPKRKGISKNSTTSFDPYGPSSSRAVAC